MAKAIKSRITAENVIDMAWKTEGLPRLMKSKGDERASLLEAIQAEALMGFGGSPDQDRINSHYQFMEVLAAEYNFDSGSRKYDSI